MSTGSARPKSFRLEGGEELEVELPPAKSKTLEREDVDFRVAYEDEHLLVVDKPSGVVVHPGAGHASGTLVHGLVGRAEGGEDEERPGIVHRLDRDTSGLLVVARSDEAHERLQDLVRDRAARASLPGARPGPPALVAGDDRRADRPGPRRPDQAARSTPTSPATRSRISRSRSSCRGNTLLNARLETGRTHQIRVHLAAVELPVVGDRVYGVPDKALGRQFLHANRLAFDHPFSGERIEIESPLPPDLAAYLSRLRGSG